MIQHGRQLEDWEIIDVYEAILKQTIKWSNCPLEEVDARNFQGRCGRIGWDVRNILYHAGAIMKDEPVSMM